MDESSVKLPGFRFHPTEEELLNFYLKSMVFGKKLRGDIIGFLNIYNHHPRELPGLAKIGEREWYFFVPRDKKHGSGGRPNRTTQNGFWKATGSDRKILSLEDPKKLLGLKKTLVFYEGRAPRGTKTDWVMNEYRLPTAADSKDTIVLCKIYRKATSMKVLEQRAAMEEEIKKQDVTKNESKNINNEETTSSTSSSSSSSSIINNNNNNNNNNKLILPDEIGNLAELQMPKMNMDWTQDSFWTQLRSPWLENFVSFLPMC
ncbi:hypothetical protein RD792_002254 [Penstemon davidsonii]|uniref:NAC domain-containing protein n=1 Tax=Penstemon davidsonii TaxID=160366 RepID=A0ABR0DQZ7_9LAMI|nr:hypothetical protein RD792_002225 [Penstemon davidsonii]KAK4491504.1 hypothetical protein RD792_002254 [Penstemon davidsonii]